MQDRRVFVRLLQFHDLPTLPQVATRILEAVEDERTSAEDLTRLIETDPAMSVRVLRLANSAYFGLSQRVDSIRRAVVVLGFDAVCQLALATSVLNTFARRQQLALDPEDFWMHSLGAAKAAQVLYTKHCRVESPEGCFTAALIHDIGKYLFALVLGKEYREVVQTAWRSQRLLKDVELEKLHTTHAEAGGWLCEKWRFPRIFKDVIGNLYNVPAYSGPFKTTVDVVALADDISRRTGFGYAGDCNGHSADPVLLEATGLTEETVDRIVDNLACVREETRQFLDVLGKE